MGWVQGKNHLVLLHFNSKNKKELEQNNAPIHKLCILYYIVITKATVAEYEYISLFILEYLYQGFPWHLRCAVLNCSVVSDSL